MKYKLINKQTSESHLCDKVTIDGFGYYVSDEIIKDVRPYKGKWQIEEGTILNKFPTYLTDLSSCRLVIATTNPNIDIPKVVDEVERLANLYCKEMDRLAEFHDFNSFKYAYNKSQETHPFSEQDMKNFGKFCIENNVCKEENRYYQYWELLQLWKEQKPKIVYYE